MRAEKTGTVAVRAGVVCHRSRDQRILEAALRQAGAEPVPLASAWEGVELARKGEIQFILATERLPGLGGFGLAREVPAGFPVGILLERACDAWLARAAGASLLLTEPLDPVAVARAVREALKHGQANRGEAQGG